MPNIEHITPGSSKSSFFMELATRFDACLLDASIVQATQGSSTAEPITIAIS